MFAHGSKVERINTEMHVFDSESFIDETIKIGDVFTVYDVRGSWLKLKEFPSFGYYFHKDNFKVYEDSNESLAKKFGLAWVSGKPIQCYNKYTGNWSDVLYPDFSQPELLRIKPLEDVVVTRDIYYSEDTPKTRVNFTFDPETYELKSIEIASE